MDDQLEIMVTIGQKQEETNSRKKDNSYVATGMNYGVDSFSSWSKSMLF
jgi:hypothetical protein